MILRVLIADDEELARERLRRLLLDQEDVVIIGECAGGRETIEAIREGEPDLVFLDVRLPDLDGFELIQSLPPERRPAFILVTAHGGYTLRAFDAGAADYLLKPFDQERFQKALQRGRHLALSARTHRTMEAVTALVAKLRDEARQPAGRLTVNSGGRVAFVKIDEIGWIRSARNYAEVHVGTRVHLLRGTLADLERQLPPGRFARISRSLLVNVELVLEIHPKSHGDYLVLLRDGTSLTGSRTCRATLAQLLGHGT